MILIQGEKLKHLTITYNGHTLYDGEIAELIWSDTEGGVRVEGRVRPARASAGPGLLDMLTSFSKQRTADMAAEKLAEYEVEQEPVVAESH